MLVQRLKYSTLSLFSLNLIYINSCLVANSECSNKNNNKNDTLILHLTSQSQQQLMHSLVSMKLIDKNCNNLKLFENIIIKRNITNDEKK